MKLRQFQQKKHNHCLFKIISDKQSKYLNMYKLLNIKWTRCTCYVFQKCYTKRIFVKMYV